MDTIAAIITAPGEAGVSVIRVSGPNSFAIADALFRSSGPLPSERDAYTFVYGSVVQEGVEIDQALLLLFRQPHSYTAEDVVEFQCHGGTASSRKVLRACLDAGARLAEPGEFTRRAFLNGRIDLLQAEAVMDVVRAHSDRSQVAALQQLEGNLSRKFDHLYDALLAIAAQLEATLDFPEDELPESVLPTIQENIRKALQEMGSLLDTWQEGHVLRDGALVVLSGKPNVGKSTLLNGLLGRDRAIVSEIAGTTRDSIEEEFLLKGFPMRLVDTAGLRDATDQIEQIGIERTKSFMGQADLHIHLIDLSQPADDQSFTNLNSLIPGKSILVCNKTDLPRVFHVEHWPENIPRVETSLQEETGLESVKETLFEQLSSHLGLSARPHAVISERHRQALQTAKSELESVQTLLQGDFVEESLVMAIPALRESLVQLGEVTGREYHEELLDQVFSTFCIGK